MRASTPALLAISLGLLACSDDVVAPRSDIITGPSAAVYWNQVARDAVARNKSGAPAAIRGYTLVSVAQHNAAVAAEPRGVHAAIAAASAATLAYLYPAESATFEAQLVQFLADTARAGKAADAQAGAAVGRTAGEAVVAYAQTDQFTAPWTGTVPTGPGIWASATPPVGATIGQAKTFLLQNGSQFRPAPHPAFGSPAFNAAVAEVRQFADTRTAEQDSIAKFWNLPAGTHQPPGFWNEEAARLVTQNDLDDRAAAHLFALMNIASYESLVSSHEAKYHYWLLRPSMADPGIALAIGLPNFPSYPSNHAAISAAMARVLGAQFPGEAARLDALAEQAALSRVYGGIHYRFDGDAGLELGRKVAAWALAHDVTGRTPFALR